MFKAGQFARISPETNPKNHLKNDLIWRAQSISSGPLDVFLEFLIVFGGEGEFSQECAKLKKNDSLFIDNQSYGFLTLERFSNMGDLWLFASGTGIAPFLSIIKDVDALKKFNRVNLVHSVGHSKSLAHYKEFLNIKTISKSVLNQKLLTYLPIVTQQVTPLLGLINGKEIKYKSLKKRFTSMLVSGELEHLAECKLSVKMSKIMICGNPEMIKDTRNFLKPLGFVTSKRNTPGEIAVENYW